MADTPNRGAGSAPQWGQQGGGTATGNRGRGSPQGTSSGGTLGTLADKAQDLAANVGESAGQAWDSTRQGVQQAASAVATGAEDAWESVTSCMRHYPFAVLGIGFGLGFLLAKALDNLSFADHDRWMNRRNYPSNLSP